MPGFHSKKEKRQAKHIIAGYKKKGASDKKAKSIAWATVNKLKNEDWQFNGAGEPVFVGKQQASQFDPSGTVSPGMPYLPDEVAKQFIKESGLRKMDTVPKRVIANYLETMGLSTGLVTDVARVLRDVYGLTPTFDEDTLYSRSGALIEELNKAVCESFPMPFIDDSEPRELTEVDVIGSFLQSEAVQSTDEGYDTVLAHLAMLPPSQFMECVEFYEAVGPEWFNYFEGLIAEGHDQIAEQVLNGLCFPGTIKFMPEHIQELFSEDGGPLSGEQAKKFPNAAKVLGSMPKVPRPFERPDGPGPVKPKERPVSKAFAPMKKPDIGAMKIAKHKGPQSKVDRDKAVPSFRKQMKMHAKDRAGVDPLAAKKPMNIGSGGKGKEGGHDALNKFREKRAENGGLTAGGKLKRAGKAAFGAIKKVFSKSPEKKGATPPSTSDAHEKAKADTASQDSKVKSGLSKIASAGKAVAKGVGAVAKGAGKAAVGAAGATAGAAGHVAGKAVGAAFRAATGAKKADDDEPKKEKKGILGHIGHAIGRFAGHIKKGFRDANPGMAHVADKAKEEPAKEAEPKKERVKDSPVGQSESLISELTGMLAEGSYPDMGEKPYGPAGDPKKGPELAKKYLEPAGVETRMFSDPEKRDKARKAKLDDVMTAINGMKKAAAAKGVPPEGMFLNLYRDMHREKVRYS